MASSSMETTIESDAPRFQTICRIDFGMEEPVLLARDTSAGHELVCVAFLTGKKRALEWLRTRFPAQCKLHHPHVLQVYDVFFTVEEEICVSFEYPLGGNLLELLTKRKLQECEARRFFQQLVFTVRYFHAMGIVGLDIALESVVFDQGKDLLKLIDLGFSSIPEDESTAVYSLPYISPEQIARHTDSEDHRKATDVWRCGVLLYNMLFGIFPFRSFHDSSTQSFLQNVVQTRWRVPRGAKLCEEGLDLLQKIFTDDPRDRITIAGVMQHPWYQIGLPPGVLEYDPQPSPNTTLSKKMQSMVSSCVVEEDENLVRHVEYIHVA